MKIIYDLNALENTNERLFPASKNRSARILKKLIKRFGGEFKKQPVIFKIGNKFIAHPIYKHRIEHDQKVNNLP